MNICGKYVIVQGRVIRIARLDADKYEFLDEPEAVLNGLRECGRRIDLFTFLQKLPKDLKELPGSTPSFSYPMEWDNLAVLPVSTFDHWLSHQIRPEARNRARQAAKKGVVVREVPFDDALVREYGRSTTSAPSARAGLSVITVRTSKQCIKRKRLISTVVFLSGRL